MNLKMEIAAVLNKYSAENGSNTPDFILAQYLSDCLDTFNAAVQARQKWYGETADALDTLLDAPSASGGDEARRSSPTDVTNVGCERCGGTGNLIIHDRPGLIGFAACPACKGSGKSC